MSLWYLVVPTLLFLGWSLPDLVVWIKDRVSDTPNDAEYAIGKFQKGNLCVECGMPKRPEEGLIISIDMGQPMYFCKTHEKLACDAKYMTNLYRRYEKHGRPN